MVDPAPAAPPVVPDSPTPAPTPAPAPATLATLDPTAPPLSNQPLAPASFPDNWRDMVAAQVDGNNKALPDRLKRFASVGDVVKSWLELEGKMSSGELRAPPKPLPVGATDEQKAEWRKTQGLPDKPETYVEKLALPNGVVLGEPDKPVADTIAKAALNNGWPQGIYDQVMNLWTASQADAAAKRDETDVVSRTQNQTALMTEWGPGDYRVNMNAVGSLLAGMPEDFKVALLTARTADGQMLGDTVSFNKWAAAHARDFNPAATLISPTETNAPKAMADELASIEATYAKAMGGDREAYKQYYGSDGKAGLDARWRDLTDAQQKMAARGRAA